MSRLRLKYVHSFVDHDGRPRHYVRRKGFKLTSLRGVYGSEEFMAAYHAALDAMPIEIGAKRTKPGSLDAALVLYYPSMEFRALAAGTQAKPRIPSARRRGLRCTWASTPRNAGATLSGWDASTCATAGCLCAKKKPATKSTCRSTSPSCQR
jgi:hypothetical protein